MSKCKFSFKICIKDYSSVSILNVLSTYHAISINYIVIIFLMLKFEYIAQVIAHALYG